MKKEKLATLKQKIAPKVLKEDDADKRDKLKIADNISAPLKGKNMKETVIRKTFCIPESEAVRFHKIKNRALDYRVVISDSEILRIGLALVNDLKDKEFHENILSVNKLIPGRQKSL